MAFPTDQQTIEVGIEIDGTWVDAVAVGDGVSHQDQVVISRGRQDWASSVDPSQAAFTLWDRDGRWSPDNTGGAYYGNYKRNIPCRVGIGRETVHLRPTGVSRDLASTPDVLGTGGGSPTAPTVVSVTGSTESTYTTTHDVTLPTVVVGDRLMLCISAGQDTLTPKDQGSGVTDLDNWTLVDSGNLYTPWHRYEIWEIEVADSALVTELSGQTVQFSTAGAVKSAAQVVRVDGARSGDEGTAFDLLSTTAPTFSTNPDPPSLTTTWGVDEHRWVTFAIYGSGGDTVSTYPTSYTSLADTSTTTPGRLGVASAHRTTSAATENPGTYALTGDEHWHAVTVCYRAEEDASSDGVLDISGDIDIRIDFELEEDLVDWQQGGDLVRLFFKSSGTNGWRGRLYAAGDNLLAQFIWHDSSGTIGNKTTLLPREVLYQRFALKITLDVNNGASGHDLSFYQSDTIDGTWTLLETITTAGTTSIGTNDAPLEIGGHVGDTTTVQFPGRIYAFELRDGIDGTVVADPDFTAQTVGASSFNDAAGRTWTIGAGGRVSNIMWRFHGELSSLPVRWNKHGGHVWSPVEAQGLFRRLRQGNRTIESALRRAILNETVANTVQYWPCEETGDTVSAFGAAIGTNAINITGGFPTAATNANFLSSSPLATPGDTVWTAEVDNYTETAQWQLRWLQSIPTGFTGDNLQYLSVSTSDMEWRIEFRDDNGGDLQIKAFRGATNVYTSAWIVFNSIGKHLRMTFSVWQSGGNVSLALTGQPEDDPLASGQTFTDAVAGAPGQVTRIRFNKDSDVDSWAFGHVHLQSELTDPSDVTDGFQSHTGETAGRRIIRLCLEEGIRSRIYGDPDQTEQMGAQQPGSLMDLLQECADTDLGILYEPRETVAVGYRTRESMLSQTAAVTLDASNGELAEAPDLDRDDQDFANDVTVENWNGTIGRAVLDDGSAMSISEPPTGAGRYDITFNVNGLNSRLVALAQSRLDLSSVDEPRVSNLVLELHGGALAADSALTADILGHRLGDVITVTDNITAVLGASNSFSQIVQGYSEAFDTYRHRMELNTTPSSPWGTVAAPADPHTVTFRSQNTLATPGQPAHVLTALGYTGSYPVTRAALDDILDDWVAGTGGTTRNVTSAATMTTALANAVPGDLIRVTTGYDPADGQNVRGDLYGISGATLTTSTDGGQPGLPIIVTCADGVWIDPNNTSSNDGVLDFQNCRHVWGVGLNIRDGQFGIRCWNWGGDAGFPAYLAYCNVQNTGHAGISFAGWFQAITDSGGTPPAGAGNEWGFSEHFVCEENTVDGVGVIADQFGEGLYFGYGGSPGWKAYCKDFWVRGNHLTDWTADGIDIKPGCHRGRFTDNEIYVGHAESGVPFGVLFVDASIDGRPAAFTFDPDIWIEGNRIWDNDLTNVDASSAHYMFTIGLSGVRIFNNVVWAHPQTGAHATFRFRNAKGTNDTEALAEFRADPVVIVNNTCWGDDSWENAGYGAGPTVFPSSVTTSWDFRNNIIDNGTTTTGEVDAAAADFIATVPAIGVAGDAEWSTYGKGSAFDLATDSALIGTGSDISDLDLLIEQDISQRDIDKTAPNPGAYQPHPANQ